MSGLPVDPPTLWERSKGRVYAILLILVILAGGGLAAAAYNHKFDGSVPITILADHAGLQMHTGNRVKIRGVDLGRVSAVRLNDDQNSVSIIVNVDPDLLSQIPDNATVSLEQLSAFGNKAIQMTYPAQPSGTFLHQGSIIAASHVSTEINSTFDELMTLLTEIKPSKLNTVLGELANSFQDNGEVIGSTITQANDYLKLFNPLLPTLQRDEHSAGGVSDVYAGAGNSIADTIRNTGKVASTINEKRHEATAAVRSVDNAGNELDDFFGDNGDALTRMLKSYRPLTSLLNQYSPEFTCFIDGMAIVYDHFQGAYSPSGVEFEVNVVQPGGTMQYKYPQDLPEIGPGPEKGPNCRGLPNVTANEDSLADYTTGPPSLLQRQPDNSPRPLSPLSTAPSSPALSPLSNPLTWFFGPGAIMPSSKIPTGPPKVGR